MTFGVNAGMLTQPESPRWQVQKERISEAEETARRLWGPDGASQLGDTSSAGELSTPAHNSLGTLHFC